MRIGCFTIFFWWLVVFGFDQDSNSDFGEHLDRIRVAKIKITQTTEETELIAKVLTTRNLNDVQTPNAEEEKILKKFFEERSTETRRKTSKQIEERGYVKPQGRPKEFLKAFKRNEKVISEYAKTMKHDFSNSIIICS